MHPPNALIHQQLLTITAIQPLPLSTQAFSDQVGHPLVHRPVGKPSAAFPVHNKDIVSGVCDHEKPDAQAHLVNPGTGDIIPSSANPLATRAACLPAIALFHRKRIISAVEITAGGIEERDQVPDGRHSSRQR